MIDKIYFVGFSKTALITTNRIKLNNFRSPHLRGKFRVFVKEYSVADVDDNSIYYFIKHITADALQLLKLIRLRRNNIAIYEPLDNNYNATDPIYIKHTQQMSQLFDYVITNNNHMKSYVSINNGHTIYHEFDYLLSDFTKKWKYCAPQVYYNGLLAKSSLQKKMLSKYDIKSINFDTLMKHVTNNKKSTPIPGIGIHICYLKPDSVYYHVHTSTKLSTALQLGCLFISNRIPVFVELLGEDYPFFFQDDLSDLTEIIEQAKETIRDKNKYHNYQQKYNHTWQQLTPDNSVKQYIKFFTKIVKKKDGKIRPQNVTFDHLIIQKTPHFAKLGEKQAGNFKRLLRGEWFSQRKPFM